MVILNKILILLMVGSLSAQTNIQLHYDVERKYNTSTLEMFKVDEYGSTFWFVDFDYENGNSGIWGPKSTSMAYWEFTRIFNIDKVGLGIQYNGGLNTYGSFDPVWLVGVEYSINLGSLTLLSSVWIRETELYGTGYQYTAVWFKPFSDRISFMGFLDVWNEDETIVLMTEPQVWYSFGNLSVGGEVEISQKQIFPTIGLKWDF
jgi:hypothetical protein